MMALSGRDEAKPETEPEPDSKSEPEQPKPAEPKPAEPAEPKPSETTEPKPAETTELKPAEPEPAEPVEPKPTETTEPKPAEPAEPTPEPKAAVADMARALGATEARQSALQQELTRKEAELAVQEQAQQRELLEREKAGLEADLRRQKAEIERLETEKQAALDGQAAAEQARARTASEERQMALVRERSGRFVALMRVADTSPLVRAVLQEANGGAPVGLDEGSLNEVWGVDDPDRGYALTAAAQEAGPLYGRLCREGEGAAELEAALVSAAAFADAVQNLFDADSPVVPQIPRMQGVSPTVRSAVVPAAFYAAGIAEMPTSAWERTFEDHCALLYRRGAAFNPVALREPVDRAVAYVRERLRSAEEGYEPGVGNAVEGAVAGAVAGATGVLGDGAGAVGNAVGDAADTVGQAYAAATQAAADALQSLTE